MRKLEGNIVDTPRKVLAIALVLIVLALVYLSVVQPTPVNAAGFAGILLVGNIEDVRMEDDLIVFSMTGKLRFKQGQRGGVRNIVDFDSIPKGIKVSAKQDDHFFSQDPEGGSGSLQGPGRLLKILQIAKREGHTVVLTLIDPTIEFGGQMGVREIQIWATTIAHATDHDYFSRVR